MLNKKWTIESASHKGQMIKNCSGIRLLHESSRWVLKNCDSGLTLKKEVPVLDLKDTSPVSLWNDFVKRRCYALWKHLGTGFSMAVENCLHGKCFLLFWKMTSFPSKIHPLVTMKCSFLWKPSPAHATHSEPRTQLHLGSLPPWNLSAASLKPTFQASLQSFCYLHEWMVTEKRTVKSTWRLAQ